MYKLYKKDDIHFSISSNNELFLFWITESKRMLMYYTYSMDRDEDSELIKRTSSRGLSLGGDIYTLINIFDTISEAKQAILEV